MTILQLAEHAKQKNIDLGKNPVRTIRYYISIGILDKPELIQMGKRKVAVFNHNHFIKLQIIYFLKKQGRKLKEIKGILNANMYWSDFALKLIKEEMQDIYHPELYVKGKPITREEIAYFLVKLLKSKEIGKDAKGKFEILKKSFVDENDELLPELPLFDGGLSFGPENDNT